ncbi:YncE family protein [Aspergillus lucknowensis]|uniref:Uncharacterized protein n=1 Tax=Aspergillus lucknowensis TaxID=176173 RepID=A0ABR4L8U3_9EURO
MDETSLARMLEDSEAKRKMMEQLADENARKRVVVSKHRGLSSAPSQAAEVKTLVTRLQGQELRVYNITDGAYGELQPAATSRVELQDEILNHAITPDLDRAIYATRNSVVCFSRNGGVLWRYELQPHSTRRYGHYPGCVFSLDGSWAWVYRPDAMADRGPDMLVVLRADTGEEVARTELGTVGHAAHLAVHPDGQLLLEVGEGQDGVNIFRAALTRDANAIDLHSYGWIDRCLIDMTPDGEWFMTVDHGRADVAFHAFPSGRVVHRLPIAALGYDDDDEDEDEEDNEVFIDWCGGFLDADTAIVTVVNDTGEQESRHYHRVNLRTGASLGRFEALPANDDAFELLGDGTWVIPNHDGDPVRRGHS